MVDKYLIMPSKHSKSVKSSHLYFAIFIIPLILYILIIDKSLNDILWSEECHASFSKCVESTVPSFVECRRAEGALSKYPFTQGCLYHNIYFIMGEPVLYFSNLSSILSNDNNGNFDTMKNRDAFFDHFRPKSLVFHSAEDLCRSHCIKFYDDTNVLGDLWLSNIGHALFDSVYAIFTGLIENNGMHTLPFRMINIRINKDNAPWIQNVVNTIAPLGLVSGSDFFHQEGFDMIHIKKLLVPNYARCLMCESSGEFYGMAMGYELDAFRLLRQHIFERFLLLSPPRLKKPHGSLNAIAVQNKRFSSRDCLTIVSAFEYVFPNISGRFVDWSKVGGFRAQLEVISDTQIHLSAPGTGMMYQTFLPDGAIHVNLGNCALNIFQTSVWGALLSLIYPDYSKISPGYMDQCMVASTPYHRALYYPIADACGSDGMTRDGLVSLMIEASVIYDSEFEIPVPRGINLSPDGLVVQGLLRGDPLFREYLMDTVAHKSCSTGSFFWPEIVVRQVGGWATGECRLNVTLLTELKKFYNISY